MNELKPVVLTMTPEMKKLEQSNDLFFGLVQFSAVLVSVLIVWALFEYFRKKHKNW